MSARKGKWGGFWASVFGSMFAIGLMNLLSKEHIYKTRSLLLMLGSGLGLAVVFYFARRQRTY